MRKTRAWHFAVLIALVPLALHAKPGQAGNPTPVELSSLDVAQEYLAEKMGTDHEIREIDPVNAFVPGDSKEVFEHNLKRHLPGSYRFYLKLTPANRELAWMKCRDADANEDQAGKIVFELYRAQRHKEIADTE